MTVEVDIDRDDDGWWHVTVGHDVPARAIFTNRSGGLSGSPYDTCNLGLHADDNVSVVLENRSRVAARLGVEPQQIRLAKQVHGVGVVSSAHAALSSFATPTSPRVEADAIVVNSGAGAAAVLVADCMPVLVCTSEGLAVVHAGWRSLAYGIIEAAVLLVGGDHAVAVIGPCIGPCCFEVGDDVARRFPDSTEAADSIGARPHVDLRREAKARLEAAGVDEVHVIDACTMCGTGYFSHRRDDGRTGRQALVAARMHP